MITIQNLTKSFDGRPVLKGLSFHTDDGSITGLLGANGAGKTTTLRTICGVLWHDSGTITVDGLVESHRPIVRQRLIGSLLDHTGLYSRLTVRENLLYFGRLRGIDTSLLNHRVLEVLSLLGMEKLADRRAAKLSQGEHLRAALGRAILHSPRNLLLDEPTNGLDVPALRSLRDLLRRLRDAGTCVVFSSHVLDEVAGLCDRVVIIAGGCVTAEGSPDEITTRAGTQCLEDAFVQFTANLDGALC